jgi:hypothetical protein
MCSGIKAPKLATVCGGHQDVRQAHAADVKPKPIAPTLALRLAAIGTRRASSALPRASPFIGSSRDPISALITMPFVTHTGPRTRVDLAISASLIDASLLHNR